MQENMKGERKVNRGGWRTGAKVGARAESGSGFGISKILKLVPVLENNFYPGAPISANKFYFSSVKEGIFLVS